MKGIFTILMICITAIVHAQDDSIANRIVLVGDAGGLINGKPPVIDAIRKTVKMEKNTTVLFLGDNLYTVGLPDEQYSTYNLARSVLDSQVSLVRNSPAKAGPKVEGRGILRPLLLRWYDVGRKKLLGGHFTSCMPR